MAQLKKYFLTWLVGGINLILLKYVFYAEQADLEDDGVEKLTDAMLEILSRRRTRR